MESRASTEYNRIRALKAFSVQGHVGKRRLNQFCTWYYFTDKSVLAVYDSGYATVLLGTRGPVVTIGSLSI